MKFYVASKFENKETVRGVINFLESYGHRVTYDWTVSTEINPLQAQRDLHGVMSADFTVALLDAPADLVYDIKKNESWPEVIYKGTLIEIGCALASGQFVFVIGDYLNGHVFMELPQIIKFKDLMEVVRFFR